MAARWIIIACCIALHLHVLRAAAFNHTSAEAVPALRHEHAETSLDLEATPLSSDAADAVGEQHQRNRLMRAEQGVAPFVTRNMQILRQEASSDKAHGEAPGDAASESKANEFQPLAPLNESWHADSRCGHELSGITDDNVNAALNYSAIETPQRIPQELALMRNRSFFIVSCLTQSEKVVGHMIGELTRLVLALRNTDSAGVVNNLFISIFESGSSDRTKEQLDKLKAVVQFLGVPNSIVHTDEQSALRGSRERIEYLADIRNKALKPLHNSTKTYDHVLWVNDVYFCAEGVLQMGHVALPTALGGVGPDAVCGMDFYMEFSTGTCNFYDKWVSRDMDGLPFHHSWPFIGIGQASYDANIPFQVFSCWNGMVMFNADLFQVQQLTFRRSRRELGECTVGEAELIFRDMWRIGRGRVVISPQTVLGYQNSDFESCVLPKQPAYYKSMRPLKWDPPPAEVTCCPLREGHDLVNWTDCHRETWDRFGWDVPRIHQLAVRPAMLSDGDISTSVYEDSTFAELPLSSYAKYVVLGSMAFMVGLGAEHIRGMQATYPLLVSVLLWGGSSMAGNLTNKLAVMVLPLPLTLVAVQMIIALAVLLALGDGARIIGELQEKPECILRRGLLCFPFIGVLVSSMMVLDECSVTTLLMARNALPLLSMLTESVLLPSSSNRINLQSFAALSMIALGTLVYAGGSIASDGLSMRTSMCIVLNMLLTVIHRICERWLLVDPSLNLSFEAVAFLNHAVGFMLVAPLLLLRGEQIEWEDYLSEALGNYDQSSSLSVLVVIFISGCSALSMAYYGVVLQKKVSATTMFVLQTGTKILTILASLFVFTNYLTWFTGLGCIISLAGGVAYAVVLGAAVGGLSDEVQVSKAHWLVPVGDADLK
mmetsp:Transcript_105005/g.182567  ORF Transcript_105005/g.182567 Transcript_105005/m.182567 type:complete len:884 (-) Transcript_105005:24-2675(-)